MKSLLCNGHVYRLEISAWLAMLVSAEVLLCAHVVVAHREKTGPGVPASVQLEFEPVVQYGITR